MSDNDYPFTPIPPDDLRRILSSDDYVRACQASKAAGMDIRDWLRQDAQREVQEASCRALDRHNREESLSLPTAPASDPSAAAVIAAVREAIASVTTKQASGIVEVKARRVTPHLARFSGYASTFAGQPDSYNDVVDAGAFADSIRSVANKQAKWPLLWQHQQETPIGAITDAKEDSHGLLVSGVIDLDIPAGRAAYSGIEKRYGTSMSIGFQTTHYRYEGKVRHLTGIRLLEASIVSIPANPAAKVLSAVPIVPEA